MSTLAILSQSVAFGLFAGSFLMLFVVIAAIAFLRSRQAGTRGVGGIPRRLLDSALTRAGSSDQTAFAAMTLPRLERSVPRSRSGAQLIRSLCDDDRWTGRYLAARAMHRLVPDEMGPEESWRRLRTLACDQEPAVRQAAAAGIAALVIRIPAEDGRLEQLLTDTRAHRAERRAALRSLIVLAVTPSTAGVAEHLLAGAARMGVPGVGALIIGRGVAQRDPDRAEGILRDWSSSPHPALREQAARAQRGIGRETRIEASNQ